VLSCSTSKFALRPTYLLSGFLISQIINSRKQRKHSFLLYKTILRLVDSYIPCQNYFCRIAQFGEDYLRPHRTITSGCFQYSRFDLEFWHWPLKSLQWNLAQTLNMCAKFPPENRTTTSWETHNHKKEPTKYQLGYNQWTSKHVRSHTSWRRKQDDAESYSAPVSAFSLLKRQTISTKSVTRSILNTLWLVIHRKCGLLDVTHLLFRSWH